MIVATTDFMVCLGFCSYHLLLHWAEAIYSTEQSMGVTLMNCPVEKKVEIFKFPYFLQSEFLLVLTFILFEMLGDLSAKPEQKLREVGPGYREKGWIGHGYREIGWLDQNLAGQHGKRGGRGFITLCNYWYLAISTRRMLFYNLGLTGPDFGTGKFDCYYFSISINCNKYNCNFPKDFYTQIVVFSPAIRALSTTLSIFACLLIPHTTS